MTDPIQGGKPVVQNQALSSEPSPTARMNRRQTHGVLRPTSLTDARARAKSTLPRPRPNLVGRRGRTGLPALFNTLKEKFTAVFSSLHKPTLSKLSPTIQLTVDGKEQVFDSRILALKLAVGTSVKEITGKIQEKIIRGEKIYQQILSGRAKGPCTTRNMTDLAWYLQAKCEAKSGHRFRDGAMTLPDPLFGKEWEENRQGCLLKFLDSHDKAYQRESSHLNRFQQMGHSHRGIDARGTDPSDLDKVLPYGLKTMLYGQIPKSESGSGKNRIFVKLEVYGCPSMNKLIMGKKHTPWDNKGPQGNFRRTLADFRQTLGHLTTFLFGNPKLPKGTSKLCAHKERVPRDLIKDYQSLKRQIEKEMPGDDLKEKVIALLDQNNPLDKSSGIKVMAANLAQAFQEVRKELYGVGALKSPGETNRLDDLAKRLMEFRHQKINCMENGKEKYDNVHLRFGNEIVFTEDDFTLEPQ